MARVAALLDAEPGPAWRPLQDTADAPRLLLQRRRGLAELAQRNGFLPGGRLPLARC